MNINGSGPEIPEELQRKLGEALFDICMFLHEKAGSSQIMMQIQHTSDALAKKCQSTVTIVGGGISVKLDEGRPEKEDVSSVLNELMAKAREKGKQKPDQGT